MRRKTSGKRIFWRGRTRDSELFTSSLKQPVPHIISIHLSAQQVFACEVEFLSPQKLANAFDYQEMKGGE